MKTKKFSKMKTKVLKSDLANWLVKENDDCGKDTYFCDDSRGAMTTDESYKKFMNMTRDELIWIIYDYSNEGQKYLEDNNLI